MRLFTRYPELRTVIVNLKTGTAFRGVLWQQKRQFLVLKNTEYLANGEQRQVDGEVLVYRNEVEFIQVT